MARASKPAFSGLGRSRLREHAEAWLRIVAEEERLIRAKRKNEIDAERRLNRLYQLFNDETGSPSLAAMKQWVERRPSPLKLGFQLYTINRWLVAEIEERLPSSMGWDAGPPSEWIAQALGTSVADADALVDEAVKQVATPGGPNAAEAAILLLAETGRFDKKRTIYRRIADYRRSIGEPSPRPHRPPRRKRARPVPAR